MPYLLSRGTAFLVYINLLGWSLLRKFWGINKSNTLCFSEKLKQTNMDITTLITTLVALTKSYSWFNIVTAAVTVASTVAAVTPTPKKGTRRALAYSIIDTLALNVGNAKETGK